MQVSTFRQDALLQLSLRLIHSVTSTIAVKGVLNTPWEKTEGYVRPPGNFERTDPESFKDTQHHIQQQAPIRQDREQRDLPPLDNGMQRQAGYRRLGTGHSAKRRASAKEAS